MVIATLDKTYTVDEYLEFEKNSEIRHEFYYGKLIEMPGESRIANQIVKNILKKWDDVLEAQGYYLYSHDVKAEIKLNGVYRYPDIIITPESDNEDEYIVKTPQIIVEVASEGSWKTDTGAKKREYSALPSLKYYIIVSQEEMFVELCSNNGDNWTFAFFEEPQETIDLPDFELKISLSDIYHRVKFGEPKTDL